MTLLVMRFYIVFFNQITKDKLIIITNDDMTGLEIERVFKP